MRGISVKTDISTADISLLPSSVGWAGDMPRPNDSPYPGDYESTLGEMTFNSASSTGGDGRGYQSTQTRD